MHIYLSNLSPEVTEQELSTLFGRFGKVHSATLVKDRRTQQAKGYGIVEMERSEEAERAITALGGKRLKGQAIHLSKNWPRL